MNKKGFTLIELLVVIAIIGLLSTLAVVALGSARERARDSRRLSDLKQLQTALEMYNTNANAYPTATNQDLGTGNYACLNSSGFAATGCASAYMARVPTGPNASEYYVYNSASGTTYTITATLEGTLQGFSSGVTLSPSGIAD